MIILIINENIIMCEENDNNESKIINEMILIMKMKWY